MVLICFSLAWIAGVFLGSIYSLPAAWFFVTALPLPLLFVPRWRKAGIIACLCLLLVAGGVARYCSALPGGDPSYIPFHNGNGVVICGMVGQYPDVRDGNTRIRMEARQVSAGGDWKEVSGTVLLYVPRYPEYSYGDMLEVRGELKTPQNFAGFDYVAYLAKQNIYSLMFYPEISVVDRGQGNPFLARVYAERYDMAQVLAQVLPEPQASLAQAMLLGLRGGLSDEVDNDFMLSGTTHILAISGMNLTILAGIIAGLGQWIWGRRYYLYVWLGLFAIWVYVLLSGASPSVIRAAVMASIFLLAELAGRQKNAAPALFLAGAVMTFANPLVLWDVSFQLSMLAMAGLIYIYPFLKEAGRGFMQRLVGKSKRLYQCLNFIIDSLMVTVAATAAVCPLTALYFGRISLVSPLATLLAVPVMPLIIILGLLSAVSGLISLPLGQATAWLAWLFLSYLLVVARAFACLPCASVEMHLSGGLMAAGYYMVLTAVLWWLNRRQRIKVMAQLQVGAG